MVDSETKNQVRQFYDHVGWQKMEEGFYQNAQFEDLRPVSKEYIHRCHLRVNRFLKPAGKYMLDAGSGPVQYDEYMTYSKGYQYRVCLDISLKALIQARKRVGERGLYVQADLAYLPFKKNSFDGIVSLHALHHLKFDEQEKTYFEFQRILQKDAIAVIVIGWTVSKLMKKLFPLVLLMERFKRNPKGITANKQDDLSKPLYVPDAMTSRTFVQEVDAQYLKIHIKGKFPLEIFVWRSVNVRFLRAVIQPGLAGKLWLKLLFRLEEIFPHFFGKYGAYPLIVMRKSSNI